MWMTLHNLPDFLVFLFFFLKFGQSLILEFSLKISSDFSGNTHYFDQIFPIYIILYKCESVLLSVTHFSDETYFLPRRVSIILSY